MFYCGGLTGSFLTVRKAHNREMRLEEMARSNIIAEMASLSERRRKLRWKKGKFQSRQVNVQRKVSRMVPTLGSDLDSTWNARSRRSGTLDGFASVKRLKRAKFERWT